MISEARLGISTGEVIVAGSGGGRHRGRDGQRRKGARAGGASGEILLGRLNVTTGSERGDLGAPTSLGSGS